jgi:hypothetical protein
MTDNPSDSMSPFPNPSHSRLATEERGMRPARADTGDGTSVVTDDERPDAPAFAILDEDVNATAPSVRVPAVDEPSPRPAHARVHVNWRHALLAGLACFAVWLVLDAPTLMRSAQDAPLGTRRSVAITVLRPIAAVSDAFGLSHVVSGTQRALGRTGNTGTGVLQVEGPPAHRHHRPPPLVPPTVTPPAAASSASPVVPSTTVVTAPDGLAPLAVPTQSAPLRLLVVGDSLGIDFGQPLVNDLAATDVVSAVLDGHIDTGLSRPDYFNWQTELGHDLTTYQPQAIVVFIGANDPQNFMEGSTSVSYGTPAWNADYAKRVDAFMAAAAGSGARVLWVGMPPMADPTLNAKMEDLNTVDQSQAAQYRGVTYFASWPVLSNPQGGYTAFLPNAAGNEVQVRDPDGTHLAGPGAQRLSQAVIAFMGHEWGLVL